MSFKKVVVAGGGVLGSQIAFQTAYSGFDVTIWLRSQGSIGRTKPKLEAVYKDYLAAIDLMASPEGKEKGNWCLGICEDPATFDAEKAKARAEKAYASIKLELDMKKAFADADLVIESMSENKDAKIDFYKKAAPLLDAKTILVTNSSTMLPSTFAKYTGRPDKYLSLHFANEIWKNNTAEIMGQAKTDPKAYQEVVSFASDIHMIPLQLHKEKNGYLLNSMLVPFLLSALDLWATDVSDPKTIDTTWVRGTGAPKGPFAICDVVGMKTCDEIVSMFLKVPSFLAPYHFKEIHKRLQEMIAQNKLGVSSGEGFFKYK
jgi:3-hydroxybutyryl-CoA dehydrogenase